MANIINDISRFTNINFGKVDAYTTDDGKSWFLLNDICEALKIRRPELVLQEIHENEKGVTYINNIRYDVITIGGIFQLIIYSNSSQTNQFIQWISYEVMPKLLEAYRLNKSAKRLTTLAVIVPEYLRKGQPNPKLSQYLSPEDQYNLKVMERNEKKQQLNQIENELNKMSYPF